MWQQAAGCTPLLENVCHDQPLAALEISKEPSVSVHVLFLYSLFL
jgi:hypothetical protein